MGYDKNNQNRRKQNNKNENLEPILTTYFNNDVNNVLNFKTEEIDDFIEKIKKVVNERGKSVSSTQLRNIYSKIKPITEIYDLKMLRPQIAYITAREKESSKVWQAKEIRNFMEFIDELIKNTDSTTLDNFKQVMEMIVAYHKYYSTEKNRK